MFAICRHNLVPYGLHCLDRTGASLSRIRQAFTSGLLKGVKLKKFGGATHTTARLL